MLVHICLRDRKFLTSPYGALVDANTFGAGNSGNLFVTADSVQVIGNSKDGQYSSNLSAEAYDTGSGGELRIDTHELLIQDGALVSAALEERARVGICLSLPTLCK